MKALALVLGLCALATPALALVKEGEVAGVQVQVQAQAQALLSAEEHASMVAERAMLLAARAQLEAQMKARDCPLDYTPTIVDFIDPEEVGSYDFHAMEGKTFRAEEKKSKHRTRKGHMASEESAYFGGDSAGPRHVFTHDNAKAEAAEAAAKRAAAAAAAAAAKP